MFEKIIRRIECILKFSQPGFYLTLSFFLLFFQGNLTARELSPGKIKALYSSLDPTSISEYLAFYQLYPHTREGQQAFKDVLNLLNKNGTIQKLSLSSLPNISTMIGSIVALVNKEPNDDIPELSREEQLLIEKLCGHLGNRRLKGYQARTEQEVIELENSELDLGRGLFLSQLGESPEAFIKIQGYEAMLDLMALQILTKLPPKATPEQIIRTINDFIFVEMGFRFPPHSLYAKDIDIYTFLPSVLDSRRGVCLGVSILYLCLAQRLNLPLEMITPPGHIYIRFHQGPKIINIETTARGVHLDTEEYLSVETRQLQQRNLKEVIGFAHINQASGYLQQKAYEKSLASYLKAMPFLPDDMLLKELMGFNYLFVGEKEKGRKLLEEVKDYLPDHAVSKDTMAEDFLNNHADEEAIQAVLMHVDETRESIINKRDALLASLKKFPSFRAGTLSLATAWLQLHREGEALEVLENYYAIDSNDPTSNYYMAALYMERMNHAQAWKRLRQAEKIVFERKHFPKALKELRQQLAQLSPE